jgi:hypothetical protein
MRRNEAEIRRSENGSMKQDEGPKKGMMQEV